MKLMTNEEAARVLHESRRRQRPDLHSSWEDSHVEYQSVTIASVADVADAIRRDQATAIVSPLRKLEWRESVEYDTTRPNDLPYRMMRCPACHGVQPKNEENRYSYHGHNPDCFLAELLEDLGEKADRTLSPNVSVAPPYS